MHDVVLKSDFEVADEYWQWLWVGFVDIAQEHQTQTVSAQNVRIARVEETCNSYEAHRGYLAEMRAKFSELDARIGDVAQNVQRGDTGLPGEYIKFFYWISYSIVTGKILTAVLIYTYVSWLYCNNNFLHEFDYKSLPAMM